MAECTCAIESFDDCNDFYFAKMVLAHKTLRCVECNAKIKPGEKHEFVALKFEGHWSRKRTCVICAELRNCFFCTWVYGQTHEDLREHLWKIEGQVSSDTILNLSEAARAVLFDAIERAWEALNEDEEE